MAVGSTSQSVESLILKATNPLNNEDDPNLVQSICQAVTNESGGIQTAVRLLTHKMQSPQEKEALQALLVLQACVNNCGTTFYAEIGKFRFLNEMIKLVSPKYLGNQTSINVKKRVTELLYTWSIDLTEETKILEAYTMLKKQNIIKEDPAYLGSKAANPTKPVQPANFEDDEKSRTLQRLLQSTRPEDVIKANALIKLMVKEDEQRIQRTSRRIVETETAFNNVKVLDDMLNQYEQCGYVNQADWELMDELNNSCSALRSNIHRIVSEMDGKEDGLGELIKASDELFRVMGRYKLVSEGNIKISKDVKTNVKKKIEEDTLLDLQNSPPEKNTGINMQVQGNSDLLKDYKDILQSENEVKKDSIMEELGSIFSKEEIVISQASSNSGSNKLNMNSLMAGSVMPPPLIPNKNISLRNEDDASSIKGVLNDLDILGSHLLQKSLPQDIPMIGSQFKAQEKVSLNEMKQKFAKNSFISPTSSTTKGQFIQQPDLGSTMNKIDTLAETLDDVRLLNNISEANSSVSPKPIEEDIKSLQHINNLNKIQTENKSTKDKVNQTTAHTTPQLCNVKPMNDLNISLDDIKPGNQSPLKIIESNGLTMTLHFTENKPRDDVSIIVVSVTSVNSQSVKNYALQAVVNKGCKVRLMPASSTKICEYSPFLPPPAITQIMLIANPNQLNVSLKVMLSYSLDEDPCSEMGEIDHLPL